MDLVTKEVYDRFIAGSNTELKNIFEGMFVLNENNIAQNDQKYEKFTRELQENYFNYLTSSIFTFSAEDSNNVGNLDYLKSKSDALYLKMRTDQTFFLHINKIYSFSVDVIADWGMSHQDYFTKKQSIEESYQIYINTMNNLVEKINSLYAGRHTLSQDFFMIDIINDFLTNVRDDSVFFENLKNELLFSFKNDKLHFSDFFVDYISGIFFLNNKKNIIEVVYDNAFLDKFYFLPFGE